MIIRRKPFVPRLLGVVLVGFWMSTSLFGTTSTFTEAVKYHQAQPALFLEPPYYGTVPVNCVYDHEYPLYGGEAFVDPDNAFIITSTVVHYDNTPWTGTVDSCNIGTPSCYSGHNGIDYDLEYELVRAVAPGDVQYAGWRYPANHGIGGGLYVHLRHSNGYDTLYGHMSVLRVQTKEG
ncbi:MAG: M23 family metallopeptidase [Anaerolineae bacterium]|nr:M23 family metallopeptidase [Anaerolineae bacterium]